MLNNKVAVITDGGCDSGVAIAKKMLANGASVVLNNAPDDITNGCHGRLLAVSYDLTKFAGGGQARKIIINMND